MRTLDEHNELSLSEIPTVQRGDGQSAQPSLETPVGAVMKRHPFSKRDWTILAASLAVAALWSAVFWPMELKVSYPRVCISGLRDWLFFGCALPGIGLTLVELAGFACILLAIGKRGRYDRTTIPLLTACFLMCLFPTLFGNHVLRVLNCLVLWTVGPFTLFLVANTYPSFCFGISSHLAALGHFFVSLIRFAPDPVIETLTWVRMHRRAVSTSADNKRTKSLLLQACLGLLASLLLLAVVLPLLISADSMFEYILEILELILDDFCESLSHTLNMDVAHVLYALILTPFIFSLTCGYARVCPHEKTRTHHPTHHLLSTLPTVMVLSSLDLIYT